jgi:hypothetical protein
VGGFTSAKGQLVNILEKEFEIDEFLARPLFAHLAMIGENGPASVRGSMRINSFQGAPYVADDDAALFRIPSKQGDATLTIGAVL